MHYKLQLLAGWLPCSASTQLDANCLAPYNRLALCTPSYGAHTHMLALIMLPPFLYVCCSLSFLLLPSYPTHAQKVPGEHGSQLFFPLVFWNCPSGHSWHSFVELHSPEGQSEQMAGGRGEGRERRSVKVEVGGRVGVGGETVGDGRGSGRVAKI